MVIPCFQPLGGVEARRPPSFPPAPRGLITRGNLRRETTRQIFSFSLERINEAVRLLKFTCITTTATTTITTTTTTTTTIITTTTTTNNNNNNKNITI